MEARDILKRPVITENLQKLWQKINILSTLILVLINTSQNCCEEIFDVKLKVLIS